MTFQFLHLIENFFFRPDSLSNVEAQWAKEVHHFCKGVPIVLVGNKSDLRGEQPPNAAQHERAEQVRPT